MKRIVIIGSGNLAESLACAVAKSKLELVQLFGRNAARAEAVAALAGTCAESDPQRLAEADLYLIAVSDRAVSEVAETLPIPPTAAVAHTAGSVSMDALARFPRRGVFYPMQTFTQGRRVDFSQIPLFLEASTPELYDALEEVAHALTRTVVPAGSQQRAQIHLAAVFACNFANYMYQISEQIATRAGFDFEVMKPLIAETAAKACAATSPEEVQTGPAVRGDLSTQQRHCTLLAEQPELEKLYQTISQQIWEISRKI